jgi:hypothetical protein
MGLGTIRATQEAGLDLVMSINVRTFDATAGFLSPARGCADCFLRVQPAPGTLGL